MSEKFILSYADYAIFSLLLVVSASVGLYFLICGKKQKSNDDYLLAGKDMSIFPISFSLMATFMSATTLMGIPAEMYLFGTNMAFMNLGFILGPMIASTLFLPIYFKTGVSTSYEVAVRAGGGDTNDYVIELRDETMMQDKIFRSTIRNDWSASTFLGTIGTAAGANSSFWRHYHVIELREETGAKLKYLEKRFGKTTRRILCVIYLLQNVLFNGASLYAPALALSAVSNLSMWMSVVSIGVVCTFYCTLGGMKAVVWTDVFQSILMYICLTTIVIKGCLDLGGIQNIFKTAYDGERILLPTFNLDFSIRYTMWSVFLQGVIITTAAYGAFQTQVQRQLTLKNLKRSVISSLLSIPMTVAFQLLCCLCGIIFYVYFQRCDPVTSPKHSITSYDQLMPYYIISTMTEYPGLPGLCIAGIFSATLSTISSSVNSMAAVTYQDIIRPIWTDLREEVLITKIASVFYGALSIFVTFLVASMGNLIKATVLVVGMISGPALGVFLLASLTTTANEMGVNIGVVSGFLLAACVTFIPNNRYYPPLPLQNNCTEDAISTVNVTVVKGDIPLLLNTSDISETHMPAHDLPDDFPISYMWITPLSLVVCLVTGYFASWIISYIRGESKHVPLELLSPLRQRFCTKDQNHIIQNNYPIKDLPVSIENTKKTNLLTKRFQNELPLTDFDTK